MTADGPSGCFALARADAVAWLASLPTESVDLLISDPPYESLEKHRAVGTTTRLKQSKASSNSWFEIFPDARFDELFREMFRVLADDRHFYLFCDPQTSRVAIPAGERVGFTFWKPLVWDKVTIGMGYHYRARYEFVLFFEKGKRRLKDLSLPDVLSFKRVHNGYPTEKPVPLLRTLISQSADRGQLVCDPFCGSGSSGAAALSEGCDFLGCDLAQAAIDASRQRLTGLGASERAVEERARGQLTIGL